MSTIINARSPFFDKKSATPLSSVEMKIYIWEGTDTTPADPVYTIDKDEIENNDYVIFEISELIRDYIENTFSGTYSTDMVWVQWSYAVDGGSHTLGSKYLACDGYGYFEDGINPALSTDLLQSNSKIYFSEGEDIYIPAFAENVGPIKKGSTTLDTISDSGNSNQKIQYYQLSSASLSTGDQLDIYNTAGSSILASITLEEVCEPKYTPMKVVFYNKFGALQDLWFFKRSDTSINTKNDSYKSNTFNPSTLSYSSSDHQMKDFNVNGNETITLNSGFYDEEHNDVVRQLLLSEQVWIDNGADVLPVNVNTKSYKFQKNVNEKLIQHTLEFSYAYDKINNVR